MAKELGRQLSLDTLLQKTTSKSNPDAFVYVEATNTILKEMGDFGSCLKNAFECMEIAEEEIVAAQAKHPYMVEQIWNSFSILRPSMLLEPRTPELYRAHAKEMLERVVCGQTKKADMEAATLAEICCVFCNVSQSHPLQSDAAAAYQKVFNQIFPDAQLQDEVVIHESFPGRADEIIGQLRRKCQQPR